VAIDAAISPYRDLPMSPPDFMLCRDPAPAGEDCRPARVSSGAKSPRRSRWRRFDKNAAELHPGFNR